MIEAKNTKRKKIGAARKKELLFYFAIVAVPFLLFLLFTVFPGYFYIFFFVVQKFDPHTNSYYFQSDIFYNFRMFFQSIAQEPAWAIAIKNSVIVYALSWFNMPIQLFAAFYVAKKMPCSNFFKILLLMPGVLPPMVWVLIYKNFLEFGLVSLFDLSYGPLSNVDQQFTTLLIYNVWLSFGGSLLLDTGIISGVSQDLIDAGHVDGLGLVGEFWHISMPTLYPVWSVGVIMGVSGFFSATLNVFDFFGLNADSKNYTIGYLMFNKVMGNSDAKYYAYDSAGSIIFAMILMPLTLLVKWVLERYGPSEDAREPIRWFWQRRKS